MCTSPKYQIKFPPTMWKYKSNGKLDPRSRFKIVGRSEYEWMLEHDFDLAKTAVEIPCRDCIECRIKRSHEWAVRLYCEAQEYAPNSCWFITFTYDDNSIPDPQDTFNRVSYKRGLYSSLDKKHISEFMKNLRNQYGSGIRFFCCGEYGPSTFRPHYHMCLFNIELKDLRPLYTKEGHIYYNSPSLDSIWKKGFVVISDFSPETAQYTAQYCVKKFTGAKNKDYYELCALAEVPTLQEEFILMSRRPGIGSRFLQKNFERLCDEKKIYMREGRIATLPKYFKDFIGSVDEAWLDKFKLEQEIISSHKLYNTLLMTNKTDMELRQDRNDHLVKRSYNKRKTF